MNTRERYNFLCRQFRIADNAAARECRVTYGNMDDRFLNQKVQFGFIGLFAVNHPKIYAAACASRYMRDLRDRLPEGNGRFWGMMMDKKYPPLEPSIPF